MLLGHWYLVVRGMSIDPLKRLTHATLAATVVRVAVVSAAIIASGSWHEVAVRQGIFFWMRAGWGLAVPLMLYPMVWGAVRIRSSAGGADKLSRRAGLPGGPDALGRVMSFPLGWR